ncbi:MAG: hypothetical protein JWP81_450 [Ferruginibacter sp.]|nr:hypothetical protein [Ferruginibacter sp.]
MLDNRYPLYLMETLVEDVFEKNNAVEVNQYQYQYSPGQYHVKHVYEYSADGYPKKCGLLIRMMRQMLGNACIFIVISLHAGCFF